MHRTPDVTGMPSFKHHSGKDYDPITTNRASLQFQHPQLARCIWKPFTSVIHTMITDSSNPLKLSALPNMH